MTVLSLALCWLLASVLQSLAIPLTGIDAGAPGLDAATFVLRALTTDLALVAVALVILAVIPGQSRLGLDAAGFKASLVGFLAVFATNLCASFVLRALGESVTNLPDLPPGPLGAAVVIAAVGTAPLAEELLFREALLARVFPRSPRAWGLAVTSVAFGALHAASGGPILLGALAVMGGVLGWLRIRTGSLGAPLLVHAANNLAAVVVAIEPGG